MPIPERISRYPIIRELGAGGMGQVYLARDPDLERRVALKVLRDDSADPRARKRLHDEAKALAALNHPGIVTVYEVGRDDGVDFIAMEYLEGESLRQTMGNIGADQTESFLHVAVDVARALSAAHSAGVLHRDIKPDNVMRTSAGVKVVDFGLAHRMRAPSVPPEGAGVALAQTMPSFAGASMVTNTIFGTPGYMAPEVLVGERATAASDVYALGVMIYELLTGRLPYDYRDDEALIDTLHRVVDESQTHPPLSERRADLAPTLHELVARMLSKRADERPSMADVADALEVARPRYTLPMELFNDSGTLPARGAISAAPTVPDPGQGKRLAPPRSRVRTALIGVGVLGVLGALSFAIPALLRHQEPASPSTQGARLVVANVEGRFSGYGNTAPSGATFAVVMTETLKNAGVEVVSLGEARRRDKDAVAKARADLVLNLRIEHDKDNDGDVTNDKVTAAIEIRTADGEMVFSRELAAGSLAEAVFESARSTVKELTGSAEGFAKSVAEIAFQLGLIAYSETRYSAATPFFEQAVTAKPEFPVAWYYLSWSRAWIASPRELTREAAVQASERATSEDGRRLGKALMLYLDHDYRGAVAELEPIAESSTRDREWLYLYAEALFHDGKINDALRAFERCMAVAPDFKPARTHLVEVAQARRSASDLRRLYGSDTEKVAGMLAYLDGDDARARELGFQALILDIANGSLEAHDKSYSKNTNAKGLSYRIAKLLTQNRRDDVSTLFRAYWDGLSSAGTSPAGAFGLQSMGRVLLIGEQQAELRVLLQWWKSNEVPSNMRFRREIELFSPAVLGAEPAAFAKDKLTTREIEMQRALLLESRGDLDGAARGLRGLVDEPAGSYRDYTTQHALLRVLVKLGASDEIARRCAVWSRPVRPDAATIVLRQACITAAAAK